MPSLAQLLAAHGTLLVLDAASACVQVGWVSGDEAEWASSDAEAAKAIFLSVETLLGAGSEDAASAIPSVIATPDAAPYGETFSNGSGSVGAPESTATDAPAPRRSPRNISGVGAFVFCEGPGSILGIRSAATAIRTWAALRTSGAPVYRYQSLALLAHSLGDPALTLIADARREYWHAQRLGEPLRQIASGELAHACAPYAMPEGFRHWSSPPPNLAKVPYELEAVFANAAVRSADLFAAAPEPDAFLHNAPSYKTWSPQIHRPPAAPSPTSAAPASATSPTGGWSFAPTSAPAAAPTFPTAAPAQS